MHTIKITSLLYCTTLSKRLRKHPKGKLNKPSGTYKIIWKGMISMSTWKELKKDLVLTQEDLNAIELEKELIRTMIHIREEKGLTQSQLAEMCNVPLKTVGRKTHPTVSLAL